MIPATTLILLANMSESLSLEPVKPWGRARPCLKPSGRQTGRILKAISVSDYSIRVDVLGTVGLLSSTD